ncbi:MAG: M23 family metallopeptidase [Actinomycetota bacterium]
MTALAATSVPASRRASRQDPAATDASATESTSEQVTLAEELTIATSRRAARRRQQEQAEQSADAIETADAVEALDESVRLDEVPAVVLDPTADLIEPSGAPDQPLAVVEELDIAALDNEVADVDLPADGDADVVDIDVGSPIADTEQSDSDLTDEELDAFLRACRTFRTASITTDTIRVASIPEAPAGVGSESLPTDAHLAARKSRGWPLRKLVTAGATVGVMGIAGLIAVSMTLPAEAVAAAQGAQSTSATSLVSSTSAAGDDAAEEDEIQAFVASSELQNDSIQRAESFTTVSLVELATEQGIKYSDELYTNDQDAAIQWPFPVGVAMSSGYGQRWGRLHAGIDLVPGEGAPIQAIADGTVRIATEAGGAYGVTVYIDHVIDGEVVTSHYAHMQYGSLRVAAGDEVKVGDIIGQVGNTGRSYGAHLHFEIIVNGSPIDPLPWMQENAGRYSY